MRRAVCFRSSTSQRCADCRASRTDPKCAAADPTHAGAQGRVPAARRASFPSAHATHRRRRVRRLSISFSARVGSESSSDRLSGVVTSAPCHRSRCGRRVAGAASPVRIPTRPLQCRVCLSDFPRARAAVVCECPSGVIQRTRSGHGNLATSALVLDAHRAESNKAADLTNHRHVLPRAGGGMQQSRLPASQPAMLRAGN